MSFPFHADILALLKNVTISYNVKDPYVIASGLGVPHTAELPAVWGLDSVNGNFPPSYNTSLNSNIIPIVQGYWTSFIRTLDPNTYRAEGTPEWVTYDGKQRILLETNTTRVEAV